MIQENKMLVIYFSHAGDNYEVGNIEVGNTKIIADYISEITGADQYEIVADKNYDLPYERLVKVAEQEAYDHEWPAIKFPFVDVAQYDTIFFGGPVWWGTYPRVMHTFMRDCNLNGKTIYPFVTHEGNGLAHCVEAVINAYPEAHVMPGLAIAGHEVRQSRNKVEQWLSKQ